MLCYALYKGHQYYRGPFDQDSTASCKQTWNIMVHITVLAIQDYSNQDDHTASDDVMSTLGLENITASGNLQGTLQCESAIALLSL